MKKIFYLMAFVAVAFTACQKQPVVPLYPAVATHHDYVLTLAPADYALLPSSVYASTSLSFNNATDAQNYIPTILNAKYPSKVTADNSTAVVTYSSAPISIKLSDSSYADVSYTLTAADYLLLPGNKYTDFTLAQVLSWLPYKYPTPAANQLALLTFTPYPATLTPPYSFLYLNGAWKQIYTITPAQYTVYGLGKYNQFTSTNDATLPAMLGALLKSDLNVQDTIKTGDVEYVSFNYYGADKGTYQRVIALEYNGSNYVAPTASLADPLNFIKKSGQWQYVQPLPVIPYTLTSADIKLIAASTVAPSGQLTNLGSYGDFESAWTTAQLDAAMILVLTADFQSPQTNTNYKVTYEAYSGGTDVPTSLLFQWNGTAWVAQQ